MVTILREVLPPYLILTLTKHTNFFARSSTDYNIKNSSAMSLKTSVFKLIHKIFTFKLLHNKKKRQFASDYRMSQTVVYFVLNLSWFVLLIHRFLYLLNVIVRHGIIGFEVHISDEYPY